MSADNPRPTTQEVQPQLDKPAYFRLLDAFQQAKMTATGFAVQADDSEETFYVYVLAPKPLTAAYDIAAKTVAKTDIYPADTLFPERLSFTVREPLVTDDITVATTTTTITTRRTSHFPEYVQQRGYAATPPSPETIQTHYSGQQQIVQNVKVIAFHDPRLYQAAVAIRVAQAQGAQLSVDQEFLAKLGRLTDTSGPLLNSKHAGDFETYMTPTTH